MRPSRASATVAGESGPTNEGETETTTPRFGKSHSLTVCLVPPSPSAADDKVNLEYDDEAAEAWKILLDLRAELRDPGYYRWPPHVNLLYPFVRPCDDLPPDESDNGNADGVDNNNDNNISNQPRTGAGDAALSTVLDKLQRVASQIEPFRITLDLDKAPPEGNTTTTSGLGTFGGSSHGVLWVYPESVRNPGSSSSTTTTTTENNNQNGIEPIVELQSLLEDEFPMCSETLKKRSFWPHLTLSSKFASREEARAAGRTLGTGNNNDDDDDDDDKHHSTTRRAVSFDCREFYLLERDGHHDQFRRLATLPLGKNTGGGETPLRLHDPPERFPSMPETEDAWVRAELDALRTRRKANQKARRRRRGTSSTTRATYRARKKGTAGAPPSAESPRARDGS